MSPDLQAWETTPNRFEEISVAGDGNGVTETVTLRIKPAVDDLSSAFVRLTIQGL